MAAVPEAARHPGQEDDRRPEGARQRDHAQGERLTEVCQVDWCRFEWASVAPEEVPGRLRTAAEEIAGLLHGQRGALRAHAEGTPWSPLEYACHTRDVLFILRDRIVVAINEDVPDGKPLYRDARVDLGLYEGDEPGQVADEIVMAADLFARTWERVPTEMHGRAMKFAFPTEAVRSIGWVAAQTLHEVEHHLGDMRRLLG